jgi:hypothetical protein
MITRREFVAAVAPVVAQDRRRIILERARLLDRFPVQDPGEATPEVLAQAEKIAKGTVFFYSRIPVEVGLKDIDWSGGHIHHQEWSAQLNRFFHLRPLAAAWRATGEERFAQVARSYIEDWLRGDNYATATALRKGDNTLNMSIRLGSSHHGGWGAALPVFLSSPAFDDAFVGRVLESMAAQADFLMRHLTAAGNWRISQLDALAFTALRFPFLPNASRLLEAGIAGLRNAFATQFLPDGVHIERTPGYADWMTDVAADYLELARMFPEADAGVDARRLVRSLDYGAQSELFGVNDAGARVADPPQLARLRRRAAVVAKLALDAPGEPPLDQVFPDAGQVFSRTAWKPGADYLAFDASTWGGGHSHLSRLSFVFRSGGRMLVGDPGILTYEMSDPRGAYGKSTAAHSTLNLGGRNQSGADAQLLRTAFGEGCALIQARYQGGYWDGIYEWSFRKGRGAGVWGEHERILFWVKGEYVLVLDAMTADAGQEIRNCWQLGPASPWSHEARDLAWWSGTGETNLSLQMVAAPEGTSMQCFEGSRQPLRGWIGSSDGNDTAAPLVEFRYPSRQGAAVASAVLLWPYRGPARPRCEVRGGETLSRGAIRHLEIALPDGSIDRIAWSAGLALPVDDARPFVTDAPFVWQRSGGDGAALRTFRLGGSYLRQR